MASLPSGTVTFLFTDIEESTRPLRQLGDHYADVLAEYRRLLRVVCHEQRGKEVDTQGDACFVAFLSARNALTAAVAAQRAINVHAWPEGVSLRVRMGIHTGEALAAETGYVGMDVHRAARICAAGHGGQILLSQTTRDIIEERPLEGLTLRDLGEHRLKDLGQAQHLYQVILPDVPADFPPLKTLDALPHNLPRHLTSFIGRDREIAEVKRLLPTTGLLTFTGPGGVGKTRLALRVAADLVNQYPDGVWVAELGALSDPALVPKTVATALDVSEQPGRAPTETLKNYLRPKSLLLVLDNCEHLLSACAQLADVLLKTCPTLRILATSREPLGLPGEVIWRVPSLSVPSLKQLPPIEQLTQYEAVHLFVDRAALSQPGFRVTGGNAAVVTQMTHRLDGIPLVIELAAARVKALPVDVIAARLNDRFRLLTGGSRAGLPRQQTLRATLDWSYDLLLEQERILLRRLSVFAGGFTLEAAEQICVGEGVDESDILDLLTHLVDKSLAIFDERDGQGRYRLLESVRQYGSDRLQESGEADDLRRRHREWYLELAEQADRELRGPRQALWLERLETEHDNLRAALEWSKTEKDGAEAGVRLAGALQWFWNLHGHFVEGRAWFEEVLARSSDVPTSMLPKVLGGATHFAFRQGDFERAIALGEKGLALCRELDDRENGAMLLLWLGIVAARQGDYERATALLEQSVSLCNDLGKKWLYSMALANLGRVLRNQGNYERAAPLHVQSLALARSSGDKTFIALSLYDLAAVTLRRGDSTRAAEYYRESLGICREVGNRWVPAECLQGLAGVACAQQQYEKAARLFGAVEVSREAIGVRPFPDETYHEVCIASTRGALGDAAFAAAWAEGRAMTLEQAIEYSLQGSEASA